MLKKILTIIYILIFAVLSYYVVTMFISRDHTEVNTQQESKIESSMDHSTESSTENPVQNNSTDTETIDTPEITPENSVYDITIEDCNSKCENIKNTEEKEYCKQVCGLSTNIQVDSCDNLSGLEKDYCIKDKSIIEKDLNKCTEILDTGIKKQCQNRINEDFMDEVM